MPATTIEEVIDEIISVCSGVSGIDFAPSDPPAMAGSGIFAIVYLESGTGGKYPYGQKTYHDNVVIQCGVALKDLARANEIILPVGRRVTDAIMDGLADGTITAQNIGNEGTMVEYSYGPFVWGAVEQFGWTIRVLDIKTQVST